MSGKFEELERALGGMIEQRNQRVVPGSNPVEGTEFVYYEDDGKNKEKKQFNLLLDAAGTITACSGGVVSDSCCITLPTGTVFHALSYHGDVTGWRMSVKVAANNRGLLLARIEGGEFVISDGRKFSLSECRIELN